MVAIQCKSCGQVNAFDQPYAYHAGLANQGFLYNDAGTLTLVWSSFDPAYEAVVGQKHPWMLTADEHTRLEDALRPAPSGGQWKFANPARCTKCAAPISDPITRSIYYFVYAASIDTDLGPARRGLKEFLL